MQVAVLAAGVGRRMRPTTVDTPKCLLRVGGETLLSRMLGQFAEYPDVDDIVLVVGHSGDRLSAAALAAPVPVRVVLNHEFALDDNLRSVQRAFDAMDANRTTVLLASDLWLDDAAVRAIVEAARTEETALFACGPFDPGASGCALHHDARGRVDELLVDVRWRPDLASHRQALGAAVVSSSDAEFFAGLLSQAIRSGDSRYEASWARSLDRLHTRCADLGAHHTASIDTGEQYAELCDAVRPSRDRASKVRLVPIEWLRPVERPRPERVRALCESMDAEAIWHHALVADRQDFLVLDGTDRLEAARMRGLRRVPVVMVDYEDVDVWALAPGESLSRDQVVERALAGDPFPSGSVKHQLPSVDLACRFVLSHLAA
jgi:choline kinase